MDSKFMTNRKTEDVAAAVDHGPWDVDTLGIVVYVVL